MMCTTPEHWHRVQPSPFSGPAVRQHTYAEERDTLIARSNEPWVLCTEVLQHALVPATGMSENEVWATVVQVWRGAARACFYSKLALPLLLSSTTSPPPLSPSRARLPQKEWLVIFYLQPLAPKYSCHKKCHNNVKILREALSLSCG